MANQIPQFADENPIMTTVPISSGAQGYEALAKTLANIGSSALQKVEENVSEQSNAMYLKSVSQMETAKVNSQIEMIKHPDAAEKLANNSAEIFEDIAKSSFVNKKDRQRLTALASENYNSLRLHGAQVGYQQAMRSAELAYWTNYPVLNKSIEDALTRSDFKSAQDLEERLLQITHEGAQRGFLSPQQYANVAKVQQELYQRQVDWNKMMAHPEKFSPAEFHAMALSPFNNESFSNVGLPANQNTQYLAASYNFDKTMQGQYSALYNGTQLNPGVILQSTPHEYEEFKGQMVGVNTVKGAINSGMNLVAIDKRMKALASNPKLSPIESGEVNYWKAFKNKMKNGEGYLELQSQTTLGGQYTQEYNQRSVAIRDSSLSQPEKFQAMRELDNNYISNMRNLGQASGMQPDWINPIPKFMIEPTQLSFEKDQPVTPALERIGYLTPENRAYLAQAMKKPNQAMSVYLVGETYDTSDKKFQADLIAANQDRDYSALLKSKKEKTADFNIWDDFSSNQNMKEVLNYMSKLPGGAQAIAGLKSAATNYVLYRAAKESDYQLNGKDKYEQDFINNVSNGFNIQSGNRYVFNGNQLNLRPADYDYLADHALTEAYKNIHEGKSEREFQDYIDFHPLHATNTPDGRIVVIDKEGDIAVTADGKAAFEMPYTSDMLAHAHSEHTEKMNKFMAPYMPIIEAVRKLNIFNKSNKKKVGEQ